MARHSGRMSRFRLMKTALSDAAFQLMKTARQCAVPLFMKNLELRKTLQPCGFLKNY